MNKQPVYSEPDFNLLFESSPGLILVLNPDLNIVAVSNRYLKATMTKREEILGKGLFEVFPDNPADEKATGEDNLRTSLEKVIKTKEPDTMGVQKYDIKRPDSEGGGFEVRYWSPVNTPVLDKNNNLKYIIHQVEDVTEFINLKNLEKEHQGTTEKLKNKTLQMELEIFQRAQEIQKANNELQGAQAELELKVKERTEELENSNKDLRDLAYVISHDLKAPLRAISTICDWIQKDEKERLSEAGKEQLNTLKERVTRMYSLIEGILQYARVGREQEEKRRINLNELVQEVIKMIKTDDSIKVEIVKPLPEIYAEPTPYFQVFQNLISNAIKYGNKNNPVIRIDQSTEGDYYKVLISDNGPGIPAQYQQKIFEIFQTLSSKDENGSTGIGLTIVKKIIELKGGKIWIESEEGKGATFYFTIPIQKATVNEVPKQA